MIQKTNYEDIIKQALDELVNLVNSPLDSEKRIFCSEADFQFALAWRIKELLQDKADIRLEFTPSEFIKQSIKQDKKNKKNHKNMHIDIVVITEGQMIPIELKYKTKAFKKTVKIREKYKTEPIDIELKNQGAENLGRYDFIYDISRLERITDSGLYPIQTAYAIFLTNDSCYWKEPKQKNNPSGKNSSLSMEENNTKTATATDTFRIHKKIKGNEELKWNGEGMEKHRKEAIVLRTPYTIDWKSNIQKEDSNNTLFKYTIVEIKKM